MKLLFEAQECFFKENAPFLINQENNSLTLCNQTITYMTKPIIAPSLLAANFGNLQSDIEMINSSECDWLHLDVMDGVFVPNISFGFPVMTHVARLCTKPLDV